MKIFLILLKHEYDGMFLPLAIIVAIMAVLQLILFGGALRGDYINAPFSHYVNSAGISSVFAVAYAGLLVLMGIRFLRNYTPAKSIYALLTLPVKRQHIYMTKLVAALFAGLVLLAAQMLLILIIFLQFRIFGQDIRNANLYLSLLEVGFLRLLFPPDVFSLIITLLSFFGSICVTFFIAAKLKSGRIISPIFLAIAWLLLMLTAFPIGHFTTPTNIFILILMITIPFAASIRGIKLFESGEVAR